MVLTSVVSINYVFAEENQYEIIAGLNKQYVINAEDIILTGYVKNVSYDSKNLFVILESVNDGHVVDKDSGKVKNDGSFQRSWNTNNVYDSTWRHSGPYVIKISYENENNWKEFEFVYCDKREQESPVYLEYCQEAFGKKDVGFVPNSTESNQINQQSSKLPTKIKNGIEYEYHGLDPKGDPLWVETDNNYFNRIMIPLIFNTVLIGVIIAIIVIVIYTIKKQMKAKKLENDKKFESEQKKADEIQKLKDRIDELEKSKDSET